MKNKRNVIIISVILVILLAIYYYFMLFSNKKVKLSVHETGNFTKYTADLPTFEIRAEGIINTEINKYILETNGVYPYEFDAYIETNWGNHNNKYIGYKLTDILRVIKNQDYKSITATNAGGVSITYPLSVINSDKVYVVFYKDGEQIVKGKVAIISVAEEENYFIENVVKINLDSAEVK